MLSDHFKGKVLSQVTRPTMPRRSSPRSRRGCTRSSIAHVEALCSGIFSLAVNKGLIERNVWREVKVLAKQRDSKPTGHYTLPEVKEALRTPRV